MAESKREQKRIARQEQAARRKELVQQTSGTTAPRKTLPVASATPIDQQLFRWSMQSIDHKYVGSWDWKLSAEEVRHLLEVLESLAGMTWREVKDLRAHSKRKSRPLHHSQPLDSIHKDARERLKDLKIDVESVFRLRHGNLVRVWGYIQGGTFHLVWFDRHHQICPVEN